jgi:hypothetical protein
MFFSFNNKKTIKSISKLNLKFLKLNSKKIAKRRRFTSNKKDSWRSVVYFHNPTSIGYFFLKFNSLFNIFLLKNKVINNNLFFFKHDIYIKNYKNFDIFFFVIL